MAMGVVIYSEKINYREQHVQRSKRCCESEELMPEHVRQFYVQHYRERDLTFQLLVLEIQ